MVNSWMFFDWMGTVAFAMSGAMLGIQKRMDIFGVTVLAVMTAVGGGIIRDVLAGITPPMALVKPFDLLLAILTELLCCAAFVFGRIRGRHRKVMARLFHLADTVGLASFTVTGTVVGIRVASADPYILPVLLGLLTAVGGGVLRDLLAQRVPCVLKMDIYASAALVGSLCMCGTWDFLREDTAAWVGFLVTFCVRGAALKFGWQLYHPRPRRKRAGFANSEEEQ